MATKTMPDTAAMQMAGEANGTAPSVCGACGSAAFLSAWARPCPRCGKYVGYEAIPYYGRTGVSFAGTDEMESGEVLRCLACRAIVRTEDCEPVWAPSCEACGYVAPATDPRATEREWEGDAA